MIPQGKQWYYQIENTHKKLVIQGVNTIIIFPPCSSSTPIHHLLHINTYNRTYIANTWKWVHYSLTFEYEINRKRLIWCSFHVLNKLLHMNIQIYITKCFTKEPILYLFLSHRFWIRKFVFSEIVCCQNLAIILSC